MSDNTVDPQLGDLTYHELNATAACVEDELRAISLRTDAPRGGDASAQTLLSSALDKITLAMRAESERARGVTRDRAEHKPAIVHVEVTDPDDPMGMPAYGGPLEGMGSQLETGVYQAYAHYSDDSQAHVKVMVDTQGNTAVMPASDDEDDDSLVLTPREAEQVDEAQDRPAAPVAELATAIKVDAMIAKHGGTTAYGEHRYSRQESTPGRCGICGLADDDGRGEHVTVEALPKGTELRVSGRKHRLFTGPVEGYTVVGHFPQPDTTSVASRVVGYVYRSGMGKAWVVCDVQGYIVVSPASIVNDSRDAALWLAEKAEWPVR